MKKETCNECGKELSKMENGAYRCFHCIEISKILGALNRVSDKLEIIIERSCGGIL